MYNIEKTTYGALQFIVTQDRNRIFPLYVEHLHSEIKEIEGVFYGINLLMDTKEGTVLLGTFDTVSEVLREIKEIYNTNLEIYCVSGFSTDLYQYAPPPLST